MSERIGPPSNGSHPFPRLHSRAPQTSCRLEKSNPNLADGDISGGALNAAQLIARPVLSPTHIEHRCAAFICVVVDSTRRRRFRMCGYHAARAALRDIFGKRLGDPRLIFRAIENLSSVLRWAP
jgi:hypothetical protein